MIYLYGSVKYLKFTACGEQTIKRQKFAMGLDESSEEDLAEEKEKEEEEKRGVKRGKAILMSDDED